MKKMFNVVLILICVCFIVFFLYQSSELPDKLGSISGWILLLTNPIMNLFPKIKAKIMIYIAKIVNYSTELKYCARIYPEHMDLKALENNIEKVSGFQRIIKNSERKWNILLKKNEIDISISSDSIYISFQKLKIGYRDIIKEINLMNETLNSILTKVVKNYDNVIFDCVISFDDKNPYLNIMVSDKIRDINFDVIIKSNNLVITNNEVKYTATDVVEFSNRLKEELLLK